MFFGVSSAKAPVGLCVAIFYFIAFHKRISTAIPHPEKGIEKRIKNIEKKER